MDALISSWKRTMSNIQTTRKTLLATHANFYFQFGCFLRVDWFGRDASIWVSYALIFQDLVSLKDRASTELYPNDSSVRLDGDIWNYKTGGFSIVLFVWVAFIGVRIPSHPSRKHRYLLGTCVYCAIKFEQSSLGIIWFILSLSHKTEMHGGTWNMLTSTHAKWVVRLTHDTQSLKTKQSTLRVQTNSKSLKAIK